MLHMDVTASHDYYLLKSGQDLIVFIHLSLFSSYWIVRSVIVDLNVQHMSLNSV